MMKTYELGIFGTGLMAAVTFPVAFGIARACLAGILRLMKRGGRA